MNKLMMVSMAIIGLALAGCQEDSSGASRESRQTLVNTEQAAVTVGMPAISNYTEKRQLKAIYELRDSANLVTYTYTMDMNGKRHSVCPTTSVGFGIPYATQYTAPKAPVIRRAHYPDGSQGEWRTYDADQPEPNGLHMPSSADATWVLCLHPDGKSIVPSYVEDKVQAFVFERPHVD